MEPLTNDVQAASCKGKKLPQFNNVVQPLLTDLYQITMAYAYWSSKKQSDYAVFDLFFRKNPFGGEFTVFAGLEDCLRFLENFHYTDSDIAYLKTALPITIDPNFFDFLAQLTAKDVKVYSVPEGTVVFPRVPLLRVEGPLLVVQLIETTFLTLINYPSLVTTNAARFTICAGPNVELLEFGLRRAQGPDGGLSASKYTYIGGFSATSNVLAGKLFGIPVAGTHSHAFVMSFSCLDDCKTKILKHSKTSEDVDFIALCLRFRYELSALLKVSAEQASDGELAAFICFAMSFPGNFLALVDTYDVLRSGLLNFCSVSLALNELGYKAVGIRVDSGDLSYLSIVSREAFKKVSEKYNISWFQNLRIVASNDINEETIKSLNEQGHEINCLGIGTHLVTCQKQPALGCVFKIVEVNSQPCIKLSLDVEKVSIPGKKIAYRLYGKDGHALIDLLQMANEPPPVVEQRVLCRHPFQETKRASVIPQRVVALHELYWSDGKVCVDLPSLPEVRERVRKSLATLRPDIKRNLNPTPYKVSVSDDLYKFMHKLWLENAPIRELS